MAFSVRGNTEVPLPQFNLFELNPVKSSIESSNLVEYLPVTSLTDADNMSPLEFSVLSPADYLDMSYVKLYGKIKIVNADGTDIVIPPGKPVEAEYGLSNNLSGSLFKQADVMLQNKLISGGVPLLPYFSMFRRLMYTDADQLDSLKASALFVKDAPRAMNGVANNSNNYGMTSRMAYNWSHTFEFFDFIQCDMLLSCNRYLLNGVPLRIKLFPNDPKFVLSSTDPENKQFKIKFLEAKLLVRHIRPINGIILGHNEALKMSSAIYPFIHHSIRSYAIPPGLTQISIDQIATILPDSVVVGMVTSDAFNGDWGLNPYNFQNFGLREMFLCINGVSAPSYPLQCEFPSHFAEAGNPLSSSTRFVEAYTRLFEKSGANCPRTSKSNITPSEFINGYSLYNFELLSFCEGSDSKLYKE